MTNGHQRIVTLMTFLAVMACGAVGTSTLWAQTAFWVQTDANASQYGSITNPGINLSVGQTTPLYIWFDGDASSYGFDGVSLDVRLYSSDGGQVQANVVLDNPSGQWTGITGGGTRSDSGGYGVDDCNAFDLTNSNTLSGGHQRFATLYLTGVSGGNVDLYLCVGGMLITDGGNNGVLWFGFNNGTTTPEELNISGGVSGLCSSVPEVKITVPSSVGDFNGDGDVDLEDFGRFQACMSGSNVPQTDPACEQAKIDDDNDVDVYDYDIFKDCISGANIPVDPNCGAN